MLGTRTDSSVPIKTLLCFTVFTIFRDINLTLVHSREDCTRPKYVLVEKLENALTSAMKKGCLSIRP